MLFFFFLPFQQKNVVVSLQIQGEFLNLQASQMSMMITRSATGTLDSSTVSVFTWVSCTLTLKMTQLAWLTILKYMTVTTISMALWEGMCCFPLHEVKGTFDIVFNVSLIFPNCPYNIHFPVFLHSYKPYAF